MEFLLVHDSGEEFDDKLMNAFSVDCYTASVMLLQLRALPRMLYISIEHLKNFDYTSEDNSFVCIVTIKQDTKQ